MRIAVLLTCYNRKEKTLKCLNALFNNKIDAGIFIDVILVDDGSSDGTAEHVAMTFTNVTILKGAGDLFWNRGMHLAFEYAMKIGFDAYIWLNDDTFLFDDALARVIDVSKRVSIKHAAEAIIVGSTKDESGNISYGGSIKEGNIRRFKYRKILSQDEIIECDVMNGNFVFIPQSVALIVGNIDSAFAHAMGDTDYALRAKKQNVRLFVAPGFVGLCSNNSIVGTHMDRRLSLKARWKHLTSRKGLPVSSWLRFTRRHGGLLWPLYFIWPYFKVILK